MSDTYAYQIGDNLYLNLTNRCSNRCAFCVRDQNAEYEGYSLFLKSEPTAEQAIGLIKDPARYREIVFCGYGEPTYRLNEMIRICDYVHANGGKTRLNTNGQGNLIHGGDIVPALKGKLDFVNISLNAPTAAEYDELCRPRLPNAFEGLLTFAESCKRTGVDCRFSAVDCIGEEKIRLCRDLAEKSGIPLLVRKMIDNR